MSQNINSFLDLNDSNVKSFKYYTAILTDSVKVIHIYSHYNINKFKLFEKEINNSIIANLNVKYLMLVVYLH